MGMRRDNGFFLRYRSRNPSIELLLMMRIHQTTDEPTEIILFLNYSNTEPRQTAWKCSRRNGSGG